MPLETRFCDADRPKFLRLAHLHPRVPGPLRRRRDRQRRRRHPRTSRTRRPVGDQASAFWMGPWILRRKPPVIEKRHGASPAGSERRPSRQVAAISVYGIRAEAQRGRSQAHWDSAEHYRGRRRTLSRMWFRISPAGSGHFKTSPTRGEPGYQPGRDDALRHVISGRAIATVVVISELIWSIPERSTQKRASPCWQTAQGPR